MTLFQYFSVFLCVGVFLFVFACCQSPFNAIVATIVPAFCGLTRAALFASLAISRYLTFRPLSIHIRNNMLGSACILCVFFVCVLECVCSCVLWFYIVNNT